MTNVGMIFDRPSLKIVKRVKKELQKMHTYLHTNLITSTQPRSKLYIPLVHKPYVNKVTLARQTYL